MRLLLSAALALAIGDQVMPDPGAAAFQLGVESLTAGDHADAEIEFTRCLDDDVIPPARRVQALYNRGTARAQLATTSNGLAQACEDLRDCLASPDSPEELRADARNNLEVAKLLLAAARSREARRPPHLSQSQDAVPPRQPDTDSQEAPPRPMMVPIPAAGVSPPASQSGGDFDATEGQPGQGLRAPTPPPAIDPPPMSALEAHTTLAEARARISRGRAAAAKLRPASGSGHALDW